jgi:selenocysteine lyase/cysteine desulfurase
VHGFHDAVVPGLISASALPPSLTVINQIGVRDIHRRNTQLVAALCNRLDVEHNGSAIVMLDVPGAAEKLKARGVRATVPEERIRVAILMYNVAEDVDTLVDAIH